MSGPKIEVSGYLGFQLGSITTTIFAPVRFRPRPPAFVDKSITRLT